MSSTSAAKDYINKAVELREEGRVDEALLAANRAISLDEEDPNAWWQLAQITWERDGSAAAIPCIKKTVELSAGFAYGWHRLGIAYKDAAMIDKAIESWEQAVEVDCDRSDTWAQLANAYVDRKKDRKNASDNPKHFQAHRTIEHFRKIARDEEKHFEALRALERLGEIHGSLWNRLGNCYFDRKQHQLAIRCYKRYAAEDGGYVAFYNLAQSLNSQAVQQRADAIDAWRRAEITGSEDEDAKTCLNVWLPKALELRQRVMAGRRVLLSQDEWYASYVNPYELLRLMDDGDFKELDAKAIQKAKKKLLQEIELEDGAVEWMPGLKTDRSRAIKVSDEFLDENLASYQRVVAENRELCSFLSRGDISFFLVNAKTSPIDLLEQFEDQNWEFAGWLSEKFAVQYDLVLTKALESRDVYAIDALLSGRRLVLPEHEDRCFEGAQRQVSRMIEPLEEARTTAEKAKPSVTAIKALLARNNLGQIVSLLPQYFQNVQNELAGVIRTISITAHNKYGDTDLAKEVLAIGKELASRSPAMLHQIEEDEKTIDEMLAEQSKHDASIQYQGENYTITRKAVIFGKQTIPVEDVRKIRFGMVGKRDTNGPSMEFNMDVVGKDESRLSLGWTAYKDIEMQEELFKGLQDAALNYLLPPIMGNIESTLDRGHVIKVGPAICTKQGVQFNIEGWFNSKQIVCPWQRLKVLMSNGQLTVADPTDRKAVHVIPLATTDNALALYFLINKYQN